MSSLFIIEHALSDLMDTRAELEAQECFTEEQLLRRADELNQVDQAIVEYITAEVRKVDNIARYLIELKVRREAIKRECERLEAVAGACERTESRIKETVLQVMRDANTKKLSGKIGSLRRQANGGVLAVEVKQSDLLPNEFKRVTVTMSYAAWVRLRMAEALHTEPYGSMKVNEPEPDLAAIRESLESGIGVPGCVLKERGEHLRVA